MLHSVIQTICVAVISILFVSECALVNNDCVPTDTTCYPALSLFHPARSLNSYRFSYTGADITGSSISCATGDMATGIGPFLYEINALSDDILITVNSNIQMPTICDGNNASELRLYVDGINIHSFGYNRCWGQIAAFTTAFVVPSMGFGFHSAELRVCSNGSDLPTIIGSYPTILTATSLESSIYYAGRASSVLPAGTTNLSVSGPFTPIVNGSSNMAATFIAAQDVLLWQNLSIGGLQGTGTNLRLDPLTAEDWTMADDGPAPMSTFTFTSLSAGTPANITAHYGSGAGNSIISRTPFDNTLNLIGFKLPPLGSYGKAVFTGSIADGIGSFIPLISFPIAYTKDARYLIAFTANYAYGNSTGNGCDFGLFINGVQRAISPLVSSNIGLTVESSLITVETIPAGSAIPVEIRFRLFPVFGTCTVGRATLTAIPLE